MSSNRLRLNHDKTQFVWFGTRQQLSNRDLTSLAYLSEALVSDEPTGNLGVLLDPVTDHGSSCLQALPGLLLPTASNSNYPAFTFNSIQTRTGARLHFVPAGLLHLLDRLQALQLIQNAAARLVLKLRKFDHISAAIRNELHWLPVRRQTLPPCSKLFGWRGTPIPARTMCCL